MSGLFFKRRVRFALFILASQILLIALAVTWVIQMVVIALNGSIKFVENNHAVLLFEIILSTLICLFGIVVFIVQWRRLGEKRQNDSTERRAPDERAS